jgi:hypothetical protein
VPDALIYRYEPLSTKLKFVKVPSALVAMAV